MEADWQSRDPSGKAQMINRHDRLQSVLSVFPTIEAKFLPQKPLFSYILCKNMGHMFETFHSKLLTAFCNLSAYSHRLVLYL